MIGVNVIGKRQAKLATKFNENTDERGIRLAKLVIMIEKYFVEHKGSKDDEEPSPDEQEVS